MPVRLPVACYGDIGMTGGRSDMDYNHAIQRVGEVIDAAGVAIMFAGTAIAAVNATVRLARHDVATYRRFRQQLGQAILLGLELLVAGDIVRTVAAQPSLNSIAVLAGIVLIRTFLSFSLEVELTGRWPWQSRTSLLPPEEPTPPRRSGLRAHGTAHPATGSRGSPQRCSLRDQLQIGHARHRQFEGELQPSVPACDRWPGRGQFVQRVQLGQLRPLLRRRPGGAVPHAAPTSIVTAAGPPAVGAAATASDRGPADAPSATAATA